jgi:hypothetical protein
MDKPNAARTILPGIVVATTVFVADTPAPARAVTFNKDILPILQRNCQSCHRPGQVAPMSLIPGRTSVSQSDQNGRGDGKNAAVVRGSQLRPLCQRSFVETE